MKNDIFETSRPSWDAVLLVCKACGKRSSGPKDLKGKAIAREAKHALRDVKPRPRVALTSCLGLCPKEAVAIAWVGGKGGARIAAVKSLAQIAETVPLLITASVASTTGTP